MSEDGLVTIASKFSVKETLDRLEANLKAKDITVFARIDHAAGAASVAMPLRPTELLIFGNPKAGTQAAARMDVPVCHVARRFQRRFSGAAVGAMSGASLASCARPAF